MNPDPFANSNPPEKPQKKKRAVRKRVLVAVLIVVTLAAAGYFVWKNYYSNDVAEVTNEDDIVLTAEQQAAQEKFAAIDAELQADAKEQLDSATSATERANAYLAMANAVRDPSEQLKYALKAVDEDKNADTLMAAINFADIAGDTETLEKMSSEYIALGVESDRVE